MSHADTLQPMLIAAYANDIEQAIEVIWAAQEAGFDEDEIMMASASAILALDDHQADIAQSVHDREFH